MLPGLLNSDRRRLVVGLRRLGVLAPLTVLSAAWTLSVAGAGVGPVSGPSTAARAPQPPAVAVPAAPIEVPASVSAGSLATRPVRPTPVLATSATADIPSVALAAYQRAEAIIGSADRACRLSWPLVAAIGRVESDHGRVAGGHLGPDGAAVPAIVGVPLDGRRGTALVSDSDAGWLDGDKELDRAIGPMQFIPTTWGVVGVDADGDGRRNPQDVDDAALAAAVYLCSGAEDLGDPRGIRRAVRRYNHSDSYVALVLSVMRSYAAGEVVTSQSGMAVPAGVTASSARPPAGGHGSVQSGKAAGSSSATKTPEDPAPQPSAPPAPDRDPDEGTPSPPAPPASRTPLAPATAPLSGARAVLQCSLTGLSQLLQPARTEECADQPAG